jgi:hypothetical protein
MKRLNQEGHLNVLLIPLILLVLLVLGAAGFGAWAFMSRQDYKNNTDQKVAAAVTVATAQESTKKDNQFVEKEKLPFHKYSGPTAYGSLVVQYPKTWSAYVDEKSSSSAPVDAYFNPIFVPALDMMPSYALRVQVVSTSYADVLKTFESNVKSGKIKTTAYIPAKVSSVTGVRLDGEIAPQKQGSMVIIPVRDKTLKIWTESPDFLNDFNSNILPNYTFEQ